MTAPTDPYYGRDYDTGKIENADLPAELVEGVHYVWDDVMQPDGTTKRTMIVRQEP